MGEFEVRARETEWDYLPSVCGARPKCEKIASNGRAYYDTLL